MANTKYLFDKKVVLLLSALTLISAKFAVRSNILLTSPGEGQGRPWTVGGKAADYYLCPSPTQQNKNFVAFRVGLWYNSIQKACTFVLYSISTIKSAEKEYDYET